jgi:hypothetical protein
VAILPLPEFLWSPTACDTRANNLRKNFKIRRAGGAPGGVFRDGLDRLNKVYRPDNRCMFPVMEAATINTLLQTCVTAIVAEVVERIDYNAIKNRKLAYTPDEVAEQVGFTSGRAVKAEAKAGRLIGSKVCGQWRFTPEQVRDYLRENEVTV